MCLRHFFRNFVIVIIPQNVGHTAISFNHKMTNKLITLFTVFALTFSVSANQPVQPSDDAPWMIAAIDFTNANELLPLLPPVDNSDDAETSQITEDMLSLAHSFIGTNYRRGGKTPKGFDCSGFTGYIFRQFGYSLGASSQAQFNDGTAIDRADIMPGDLLFFRGSSSKSIGHVAIAVSADPLTGEITFIHSAIKGGIRLDKISAPYYANRFVGARRVITQ